MKKRIGRACGLLFLLLAASSPSWAAGNGITVTNHTFFCMNIRAYSTGRGHGSPVNIPAAQDIYGTTVATTRSSTLKGRECISKYVVRLYNEKNCANVDGHTTPQARPERNTLGGPSGCNMLYYDASNPVFDGERLVSFTLKRRK